MDEMVDRLLDILADKLTERLSAGHKELYTAKELAERYGVSCATIRSKMAAGEFGELVSVGENFNPRPPRGGRHQNPAAGIRAVLFQSTPSARRATLLLGVPADRPKVFQSTPSARRATGCLIVGRQILQISIHALREEGDPAVLRGADNGN